MGLPIIGEAKALVRIHPFLRGLPTVSLHHMCRLNAGSESDRRTDDGTAKCPESLCPVPALPLLGSPASAPERTLLLCHCSYGLMRQSHLALPSFGFSPRCGSLCRLLPDPCCQRDLPDVISASLSRDAWAPTTTVRRLLLPVTSPAASAFPKRVIGRRTVNTRSSDFPAEDLFEVAAISLCSGLSVCLPPWSLPPHSSLRSRRWRLRPSRTCLVTLTCIGYASRPKQAIDDTGTLTPLDSQPCRLLRSFIPYNMPVYPGALPITFFATLMLRRRLVPVVAIFGGRTQR